MLETLAEAVPLIAGGVLGLMIRDEFWVRRLPRPIQVAIISLFLGGFQTWIAGELSVEIFSSCVAILIDSAAVALGFAGARMLWVGVRLLRTEIEMGSP